MRAAAALFVFSLIPAVVFGGQLSSATFQGDVVVRSSGERSMAILLDSYGRGDDHDGLVDHAWVVSAESAYEAPISLFMHAARVTMEPGRVTVYSPADHTAIVFLVDGTADDQSWLPHGVTLHRYSGYGVAHYKGTLALPPISTRDHGASPYSVQEPDPWDDGATGSGCQSGGFGSSSCSQSCSGTSNCETSCNAGYYACCYCTGTTSYCKCFRTGG